MRGGWLKGVGFNGYGSWKMVFRIAELGDGESWVSDCYRFDRGAWCGEHECDWVLEGGRLIRLKSRLFG